jgi:uncharacterized membrane protein YhaH (DUF805 family)
MTENSAVNPYAPPQAELEAGGSGADTTFTLNLFSAAGRIGRIRYLGYSMGIGLLIALVAGVMAVFLSPFLAILAYVAMIYVNFMLTIKRCHDFDTSGWMSLLMFVPLANLIFLFVPGTNGPNRFGNKTAPNGSATVVVIGLLIGCFVLGILAAIAIPAYQGYLQRAQEQQQVQVE